MDKERTYFPITTVQQRRLLFEIWEETGDLAEACRRAHVSAGTFYYWKPRFEAGGYAALEELRSRAPKAPSQSDPAIAAQVVKMREAPDRRRVGQEQQLGALGQPKHGETHTARRRTLAPRPEWGEKGGLESGVRTAEAPDNP